MVRKFPEHKKGTPLKTMASDEAILETAEDMHMAGIMDEETYRRIRARHEVHDKEAKEGDCTRGDNVY